MRSLATKVAQPVDQAIETMTLQEAAKFLRVRVRDVTWAAWHHQLPTIRRGTRLLIDRQVLLRMLDPELDADGGHDRSLL